jgi:protein arginine N-methyltransferase 5
MFEMCIRLYTTTTAAAAAAAALQALGGLSHMALWLQLPMTEPAAAQQQQQEASAPSANSSSSSSPDWFEYWCTLFTLCEQSSLLGVALVVPPDLPSKPSVQRWLAQPLKALLLPTSEYLTSYAILYTA